MSFSPPLKRKTNLKVVNNQSKGYYVRKITGSSEDINLIQIFCNSDENEGILWHLTLHFTCKTNIGAFLRKNNNQLVQNYEQEREPITREN